MIRDKRPPKSPLGSQVLSAPGGSVALERMYICKEFGTMVEAPKVAQTASS
jgi:hypothetical protein